MTSLSPQPAISEVPSRASQISFLQNDPAIFLPEITADDFLQSAVTPVEVDLQKVEHLLRTSLESKVEGVPEMMAYLIKSGGKRIRPLLTCLLARACGFKAEDHLTIACVAELLHTATLYHDDVVDNATLRRGRPTANCIFGNKIIVLSGDLMLAHCFSMLMEGGYFPISQALSQTVKDMVEGEILQLQCEGDFDTSIERYEEMIGFKTASLFSWCSKAAGLMAGLAPEATQNLSQLGYHIGMAFQLVDDYLDFAGNQNHLGKNTFHDLHEGKITLPLLLILKHEPQLRASLQNLYSNPNEENSPESENFEVLKKIEGLVKEPKIMDEHKKILEGHLTMARKNLFGISPSLYRTSLLSLLEYLGKRTR